MSVPCTVFETEPSPFQRRFVIRRLRINMINLTTKFEVSICSPITKIRKTTQNVAIVVVSGG